MSEKVIGKCSICGGLVTLPIFHLSVIPPVPQCKSCGAVAENDLPVIRTVPVKSEKQFRKRISLDSLLSKVTVENSHPEINFGAPVGQEI